MQSRLSQSGLCGYLGVDGSRVSIIVGIIGDDLTGVVPALRLIQPDAESIVVRGIADSNPRDVKARDFHDRSDRRMLDQRVVG